MLASAHARLDLLFSALIVDVAERQLGPASGKRYGTHASETLCCPRNQYNLVLKIEHAAPLDKERQYTP